jgi:lipopolysaccharide/colanic/teichoic acid biosynthesis glycosyltransferase
MVQRRSGASGRPPQTSEREQVMSPSQFRSMLAIEQRRCERSGRRIVVMLVGYEKSLNGWTDPDCGTKALRAVTGCIRDTDIPGWYEDSIPGVIFTELGDTDSHTVTATLSTRIMQALNESLGSQIIGNIRLSFHVYPAETSSREDGNPSVSELLTGEDPPDCGRDVKRAIDITGSLGLIILLFPLLLAVALAVKFTSRGPVLFRQTRMGRNGQPFTFLKFRSMQNGNDAKLHQEFVTKLIRGELHPGTKYFKLVADPRITPLGHFLRRTSLDELPQLFNVLTGHMSLVGPRPPLPYEFVCYKSWHRRRLANIRPGITGLWQVKGRSRVGFDDMVRLDLRYARTWSVWLDFMILLATPRAVLSGKGAH